MCTATCTGPAASAVLFLLCDCVSATFCTGGQWQTFLANKDICERKVFLQHIYEYIAEY